MTMQQLDRTNVPTSTLCSLNRLLQNKNEVVVKSLQHFLKNIIEELRLISRACSENVDITFDTIVSNTRFEEESKMVIKAA